MAEMCCGGFPNIEGREPAECDRRATWFASQEVAGPNYCMCSSCVVDMMGVGLLRTMRPIVDDDGEEE